MTPTVCPKVRKILFTNDNTA